MSNPTQSEILERQGAAVASLEANTQRLNDFMHNPAGQTVVTESGPIPTLAGLLEEIRQRAGYRRYEICWSVEELERYDNGAEAMFRTAATPQLYIKPDLAGSVFGLAQASSQPVRIRVIWGTEQFVILFAANATTGVVESSTITEETLVPPGTMVEAQVVGSSWNARGLYMTLLAFLEPEASQGGNG